MNKNDIDYSTLMSLIRNYGHTCREFGRKDTVMEGRASEAEMMEALDKIIFYLLHTS